MFRFTVNPDSSSAWYFDLASDRLVLGSAVAGDLTLLIQHPSVAGEHCELVNQEGNVVVRDLGSGAGTFINGEPVTESVLLRGQTLRIGDISILFARDQPSSTPVVPSIPVPRMLRQEREHIASSELLNAPSTFAQRIQDALLYPVRGDGWIFMGAGTLFFCLMGLASSVVFIAALLMTGYLVSYLQQVIQTSASGDSKLPAWPDLSEIMEDIVIPYVQFVAVILVTIAAPFYLNKWAAGSDGLMVASFALAWLVIGGALLPMALLSVALHDSLAGLNPALLGRSIFVTKWDYLRSLVSLVIPNLLMIGIEMVLEKIRIPLVSNLVEGFVGLYFVVAQMRFLGLFYRANRSRLGWFE